MTRLLNQAYGPYAFGVITLLIVWFVVVRPTLEANRIDTQEVQQIAETLRDVSESNRLVSTSVERTSQTMAATADTLERTAQSLQRTADDLKQLKE